MKTVIRLVWLSAVIAWASGGNLGAQTSVLAGAGYIDLEGGTGLLATPSLQSGTPRFLWWPDKRALFFGAFQPGMTSALIGQDSIAGGLNALASNT